MTNHAAAEDRPDRTFIPGLDLAQGFYVEAVAPVLARHVPELQYSAGLIGPGSEVLRYDDVMSTDHHWGPRVMLFLSPSGLEARQDELHTLLAERLPPTFRGYATHWTEPDPEDHGTQHLGERAGGPIRHRVELLSIGSYLESYLGVDPAGPLGPEDWLALPWQKLRSVTDGRLFRDDLGLKAVQERLRWYPDAVWRYLLASCWTRIGQEEHLMGRAGIAGDDVGSAVIAARLVRDCMRLALSI